MSDLFVPITDVDDFRQGDIIRRLGPSGEVMWGVVITADCDIAKKKSADKFSWLQIVTMREYLEEFWAPQQIDKLIERQAKVACENLNAHMRRTGVELSPLTKSTLVEWLTSNFPDEIVGALAVEKDRVDGKMYAALNGIRKMVEPTADTALDTLIRALQIVGHDEKKRNEMIRSAFDSDGGFQDFFVLPELPNTSGYGFVVLLRVINSVERKCLFVSEQDARIHDNPTALHRIGRLNDRLKFAIAQKMAFLFSRIGMLRSFEVACDSAGDIVVESLTRLENSEKH